MTNREIIPLPPIEASRGYTLQHAALYLDVSVPTVYALIAKDRLPTRQLGKRRIVPGAELLKFLNGEEPGFKGDPINPRMSEIGRAGGLAGGLAKARKALAKDAAA